MLEKLKSIFSTSSSVADMTAGLTDLENALAAAKALAAQRAAAHDGKVLDLIGAGDEKALAKSRDSVTEAEARVHELRSAITLARARLETARLAEAEADSGRSWARANTLLDKRDAALKRIQDSMDQLGVDLQTALELTEQAWQEMPNKPEYRPKYFIGGALMERINIYLYGVTGGRLGHGSNVYRARTTPDLVAMSAEIRAGLQSKEAA